MGNSNAAPPMGHRGFLLSLGVGEQEAVQIRTWPWSKEEWSAN
ncbi:hypothetical protein [Oryzomonas rubra]|nr:hypothetical protein [Oryzomonas rubra]